MLVVELSSAICPVGEVFPELHEVVLRFVDNAVVGETQSSRLTSLEFVDGLVPCLKIDFRR